MDSENKKPEEKERSNYVIVAVALAIQGFILVITGVLLGVLNEIFNFHIQNLPLIILRMAFVISGIVDFGIAIYFYKKSKCV